MNAGKLTLPVVFLSFLFLLPSCKDQPETVAVNQDEQYALGFKVIEQQCASCHSLDPNIAKLAPAMSAVKQAYLDAYPDQAEFQEAMGSFLRSPSADKTIMTEAVKKYGVMPKYNLSENEIAAIAEYIWHAQLEDANWYETIYPKEKEQLVSAKTEKMTPVETGKKYAMATKAVLGKNLLAAIQEKGSAGAVDFCNTRAIPLTDSMATHFGVSIRRVTDKPRNENNQANTEELVYIAQAKEQLSQGKTIIPQVKENADGTFVGYYPIETNEMCLQCHGQKDTHINTETWNTIHEKYPQDLATGYGAKELRGIWVINFRS